MLYTILLAASSYLKIHTYKNIRTKGREMGKAYCELHINRDLWVCSLAL